MPDVVSLATAWVADHPWWCLAAVLGVLLYARMMRA